MKEDLSVESVSPKRARESNAESSDGDQTAKFGRSSPVPQDIVHEVVRRVLSSYIFEHIVNVQRLPNESLGEWDAVFVLSRVSRMFKEVVDRLMGKAYSLPGEQISRYGGFYVTHLS